MALTKYERLALMNQYRILSLLEPGEKGHAHAIAALGDGYESAIDELFSGIFDGLPADECGFVVNVMAMYDALQRSYDALTDRSLVKNHEVEFRGFDGNHESAHMAYARFVVQHEERFTYLRPTAHDFNAHMARLGKYRAMLAAWKSAGEPYDMTAEAMRELLDAK